MHKLAREFVARCEAWRKAHPSGAIYPTVHPHGDSEQRNAYELWRAYFAWVGYFPAAWRDKFKTYRDRDGRQKTDAWGTYTVPCLDPRDFDFSYDQPPATTRALTPRELDGATDQTRRATLLAMAAKYRALYPESPMVNTLCRMWERESAAD